MSLAGVAKQTLEIVKRGEYQSTSGLTVYMKLQIEHSINNTRLYTPDELTGLIKTREPHPAQANDLNAFLTLYRNQFN